MKKFFLALLAAVCLTCAGLAAASCKEAQYYTLYFYTADGANVVCEIPSGYEVRSGYRVVFKVDLDADAEGDPQVEANGKELKADGEGFYSFKIKENTTVRVSGVYASGRNAVLFDKGDNDGGEYRVSYTAEYVDENGLLQKIDTENDKGTPLDVGTEVTFTIDVSVYYGENPEYEVLSNTQVISPQNDGKYHVTVDGQKTISIQGLELDDSFVSRKGSGEETYVDGSGTSADPYKLRKPIDLYVLASFMSSDFYYGQLSTAYFSLENDIDMKGEELFIIGVSDSYYFGGNFNGNGHAVSDYYISSAAVDQDDYAEGFMPNVAMFGVAAGAEIYDLNLKNFTVDVNAVRWDTDDNTDYNGFFAGGLVAYGVGVNITNCSVNGRITAAAGNDKFGYVGGLIGYLSSASLDDVRYYSTVRSCSSDVTVLGNAGCIFAAGGIAGCVRSYDETTAAMIINSYATGDVEGAMRTGGIAGVLYPYGSITNCYATGYVDGYTRLGNDQDYGDYRYAYAGGIAGELDYDAIIANSFFAGEVTARSAAGSNFAAKGDITGFIGKGGKEGGEYIQSENGLVYNCVPYGTATAAVIDNDYIQNTLGWSDGDWTFNANGYPTVNAGEGSNSFGITVVLKGGTVNGGGTVLQSVTDAYYPMSYWYMASDSLSEFLSDDGGLRSYGYYFDENLTVKVPAGYLPTCDVTLYAGFADYAEVSGKYYLQWTDGGSGKYIELTDDGKLIYRDGALTSESYYYYDGATVVLRDTYIAIIDGLSDNVYTSFKATVDNGVMTIWDNEYYPATEPVKALKKSDTFHYGKYYGASCDYTFNTDGTGVYATGETRQTFTYTVNGENIEINRGGSLLNGNVSGGKVTVVGSESLMPYHEFEGVWEKSAGSHKQYTFDGKGGWSYLYFGYESDGSAKELDKASGSYEYAGSTIDLKNGTVFTVKDGCLVLGDEVYYYKQNSYAGTWSNFARQLAVEVTLGGITAEGYGKASVNYGANYGSYDLTYEVRVGTLSLQTGTDSEGKPVMTTYENSPVLYLYRNDVLVASLVYRENSRTLWGSVYSVISGADEVMTFYLYDDFRGDWISVGFEVTFNGLGNYNVSGTNGVLAVNGTATLNGASATYTLDDNTLTGKLVCGADEYNLSYDEVTGKISVTGAATFVLQPRDKWYKVQLIDGSGNVYSFDGKSDLTGGGTMTVTAPNGDKTTQNYTAGTVTVSGNDFKLGSTTLYVYNKFTGSWYISGSYGEQLVINNFDATYTASGSYRGEAYAFKYYPDGGYVEMTDPAHPGLLPLYISVFDVGDVTELAIGTSNNADELLYVCIKGDFDDYKGDYSYDGGTLTLDGFGNSMFADGSAKYVKGGETVYYVYSIDEFGQVLIRRYTVDGSGQVSGYGLYNIFYEKDGGAYEAGGKHFAMVLPDNLYTVKATDESGALVSFYGNGIAKGDDGKVYAYTIEKQDTTLMEYTLTMTCDGETKTYVLDYTSRYNPLKNEYYKLTVKE